MPIRGSFPEVIWTISSGVGVSQTKIYQKSQFSGAPRFTKRSNELAFLICYIPY